MTLGERFSKRSIYSFIVSIISLVLLIVGIYLAIHKESITNRIEISYSFVFIILLFWIIGAIISIILGIIAIRKDREDKKEIDFAVFALIIAIIQIIFVFIFSRPM